MTQRTNFNVSPYFDDYNSLKNFYKILFRSGYSIQSRELTQLQDILQNQIESLGSGIFKEGQMVVPGEYRYVNNADYIKISRITSNFKASDYVGCVVTGESSGVKAKVLISSESTDTESVVFFVQYISSGNTSESKVFTEGETLLSDHPEGLTAVVGVSNVTSPTIVSYNLYDNAGNILTTVTENSAAQGSGTYFEINSGIYFLRGYMVRVDNDSIILSKFHDKPTGRIGFSVNESVIVPEDDSSLFDNAQGYSNFSAPGAHRFSIRPTLAFREINEIDEDFVEIARVVNGVLQRKVERPQYKWLFETLARRTYDESGNYVVKPFSIDLKEWINTNDQDGLFVLGNDGKYGQGLDAPAPSENVKTQDNNGTIQFDDTGKVIFNYGVISERLTAEEADSKFVISLGSGKAYVNGYEIESNVTDFIVADKARTTQFRDNVRTSITEGQHTYVTNVFGSPDLQNISTGGTSNAFKEFKLHKTFTDGYVGLSSQNIGNECQTTYHLVTTNTTVYTEGASLGTGTVIYFAAISGGSVIVLTGTSDYVVGGSIGNGVINSVYKQSAEPVGIVRPKFFKPSNIITDTNQKANKTSEFKLGLQSGTFFTHLYVRTVSGTPVAGKVVIGSCSRAKAIIESGSTTSVLVLSNVVGNFESGESVITEDNSFSCTVKRIHEVDSLVITNFTNSPTSSITVTYSGQDLVLNNSTDYTKSTNGSRYTLTLTTTGRNKIYNFYNGTPGYVQITKIDSNAGVAGYGVIVHEYYKNYSFNNVKSLYGSSSSDNEFSADFSYLNVSRTASFNLSNGANYSGTAGSQYLECQDVGKDPSLEVSTGDILSVVDDNGTVRLLYVHFATKPVGQSDVRQNGRIYVTTVLPANITRNQVVVYRSKTNNADRNSLIYKLPTQTTATLETVPSSTDINYTIYRQFMGSLTGGNTITFTIVTPGETFLTDVSQYVFTFADATAGSNVGKFVQLRTSDVVFSDSDKKITITLPFAAGGNYKVKLIAPVSVINARAKRKIKRSSINPLEPNYTQHVAYIGTNYNKDEISLNVVDAFKLRSVYAATTPGGNPTNPSTRTNVSDRYYLKSGQTDNYYGVSSLVLKRGYQPAQGPLYVDFDYFEHSDIGDFFSVDSYTDNDGVDYGEIPTFDSDVLGTVELRDCIDFRPSVNPSTTLVPAYDQVGEIGAVTFVGGNVSRMPAEFTTFDCDIENYLPRKDSIFLSPIGDFILVSGTPSERPQFPADLSGSMRLFDLSIPAYTFSAKDVVIKQYNHQRYTMRDIQYLDNRVKRLEEVVSLSLLEQNTLSSQVIDAQTGLDRFKNGIVVDDFRGHVTGAAGDPEYKCSIDTLNTHLRAPFYSQQVGLEESTSDNSIRNQNFYRRTNDFIHLPYTNTELFANRNVTSFINIQPYSVFTYTGELSISPEIDEWNDVTTIPENRIVDETTFNALSAMAGPAGVLNTQWNEWNTTWSGISQTEVTRTQGIVSDSGAFTAQRFLNQVRAGAGNEQVIDATGGGNGHGSLSRLFFRDTIETRQQRTGVEVSLDVLNSTTVDTNLGPRVVDVTLARYMRQQVVKFRSTGLKPNTRFYAFFDGQDVNSWVSPDSPNVVNGESIYNFEVGQNQKGFGQSIISDNFGNAQGIFVVPTGTPPKPYVKQSEVVNTVNGISTSTGVGYVTNSVRTINGTNWYNQIAPLDPTKIVFYNVNSRPTTPSELANDPNFTSYEVPAGRQFKVGDRMFRLTSSINNSRLEQELEAYAEKTYTANGLIQTRQNTVISTRVPAFTQRQITDRRTITEIRTDRTALQVGTWGDPVAQTFTIDENDNPKGCFVTGIDLFFRTKSDVHGVDVYLTSTDSGRPTEIKIPGAYAHKSPNSYLRIQVTLLGSTSTLNFASGTTITGQTSGAVGVLKQSVTFQSASVNPTNNVTNTVYDIVLSNYTGTFVPGETIKFGSTTVAATFVVVQDTYKVNKVNITNFGVGYTSLDDIVNPNNYVSVQFSAPQLPGGIQATGYAKVSNGKLYDVIVTNPGSGYTSTPSVTFVGGGATVAATATVSSSLDRKSVIMGVSTSPGGTVPTRFDFESPVYLENGKTYAFVVYCPTSVDYTIFVSKIGERKLLSDGTTGQEIVNKQPTLGSLFKSQNASLWTEDQTQDVSYVMYKARFDTSRTATVHFDNSSIEVVSLGLDPITTNSSEGTGDFFGANPSVVRVRSKQPHGLIKGDLVVIGGITGTGGTQTIGGIDINDINRQHVVLHSDFYTFDINVGSNATSSVTAGGYSGFVSVNLPYEVLQPQVSYLNFQETSVEITATTTNGGSIDEGYVVGSYTQNSPVTVYPGSDYYFRKPQLVANRYNEVLNSGATLLNGKKSLRLTISMSSLNPDLSPIIDVMRTNAILVRSLIDDPDLNDDRFGPTRTLLTFSSDVALPVGSMFYGVTNETSLNGSVSRIISYSSSTKEALVERTDAGSIIPSASSSGFSVNTTKNTDVNASVSSSTGTITVVSPHNLTTNDFIKINNEIMKVTGTTSTTLTVTRGLFGTTATTHAVGDDVFKLILVGDIFTNKVATITEDDRTGSLYYVPETDPDYGSSFAKFKTRTFTLENPSDRIDLTMSAVLFDTSNLKCYYRTRSENDSRSFLEIPWVPFNGTGLADNSEKVRLTDIDDINPSKIAKSNFFEYKFTVGNLTPFTSFELKFVMNSTNPALSPVIDDYRVICTV